MSVEWIVIDKQQLTWLLEDAFWKGRRSDQNGEGVELVESYIKERERHIRGVSSPIKTQDYGRLLNKYADEKEKETV